MTVILERDEIGLFPSESRSVGQAGIEPTKFMSQTPEGRIAGCATRSLGTKPFGPMYAEQLRIEV